jgi:DoxX-like protein
MEQSIQAEPVVSRPVSKVALWTGRVLSTLIVLFMLMDTTMKFMKPEAVIKGTEQLGYQENQIAIIGGILLVFTVLYAIPQTAVLGAICLTTYLGGAFASRFRIGQYSNAMFVVVFGIVVWLGPLLRDRRLRQLLPVRR